MENINTDKLIASILTFVGLPGQIIARIIYKYGSLDKAYLFLFAYPPFSIIPALAMWFNFINDAEIKDKPFDINLLIGMLLIIIIPFILYLRVENKLLINILVQIGFIGIIQYIYDNKFNRICTNKENIIDVSFSHAILLAPLSLLFARIIMIILTLLNNKFNISNNLFDNNKIDFFTLYLFTSLSLAIMYTLINMLYSTNKKANQICNNKIKIKYIIILLIINMIIPFMIKPKLLN